MRKTLNYFMILSMLIFSLIFSTEVAHAYDATLSVGVSSSVVKIGDKVTVSVKVPGAVSGPVSLYFPTDIMEYVSASTETSVVGGTIQFSIGKGGRAASDTVSVDLKAKTEGDVSLKVESTGDIYDYDSLEEVVLNSASAKITVENQTTESTESNENNNTNKDETNSGNNNNTETTPEPPKSADNSLSSLKLSNGTLSPSFKYDVTKYTATVDHSVESVVVSAKTSNSKATIESVTDDGSVKLNVGENTIKVVVKAENGVKSTYTIVVTRKDKQTTAEQPKGEEITEVETETEVPAADGFFEYCGEQLTLIEDIPEKNIPSDFESKLLVVKGQQMKGLSFKKGDLKVLYLNNANNAGSLYVYDETYETIYPFVKIASEKKYIIILMPNENTTSIPEGYESCELSIEGKGIINAYRLKKNLSDSSASTLNLFGAETFYASVENDFYLIYCMTDKGDKGWYMYDAKEETFMRYQLVSESLDVKVSSDLKESYDELKEAYDSVIIRQYVSLAIAFAFGLVAIMLVVMLIKKTDDNDDDEFADDDDIEDYEEVDDEQADDECVDFNVKENKTKIKLDESLVKEIEQSLEEELSKDVKSMTEDDDDGLEFIDFE